jgi:hypothetical protein
MINPAGVECQFYYEDFFRGQSEQDCRLIRRSQHSEAWTPKDCANCPVPDILLANSSPNLVLEGTIKKGLLGLNRRVEVKAFCSKHLIDVEQPHVGCPKCAEEKPGLQALFGNEK